MRVLLIKDVYKLGHAGEVKKVADGYGRNYLIPQGLAVIATPNALQQAERIRTQAALHRAQLNEELSGVAAQINGLEVTFPAKAGETGKLYGSITTRMIAEEISRQSALEIDQHQIDTNSLRMIGVYQVGVRLTMDLAPVVKVIVYREGESPSAVLLEEEQAEVAPSEVVSAADAIETEEPEALEETPVEAVSAEAEVIAAGDEESPGETSQAALDSEAGESGDEEPLLEGDTAAAETTESE